MKTLIHLAFLTLIMTSAASDQSILIEISSERDIALSISPVESGPQSPYNPDMTVASRKS